MWLEQFPKGDVPHRVFSAVWPFGYRARLTPRLEVIDASGAVVVRQGDLIREVESCLGARPEEMWVLSIGEVVPAPAAS